VQTYETTEALKRNQEDTAEIIGKFMQDETSVIVANANSFSYELDRNSKILEGTFKNELVGIINHYILQYDELAKRIDERYKRLSLMDKADKDLKSMQQKSSTVSGIRTDDHRSNYLMLKESYDSLNNEIKIDLRRLLDDRRPFMEVIYPLIADAQIKYFHACSNSSNILNNLASTDVERAKNYQGVITPYNNSVMYGRREFGSTSSTYTTQTTHETVQTPTGIVETYQVSQQNVPTSVAPTAMQPPYPKIVEQTSTTQYVINPPITQAPRVFNNLSVLPQQRSYAVALYDFDGAGENELPFKVGDQLAILSKEGPWWVAEFNGRRGYIPANYVQQR